MSSVLVTHSTSKNVFGSVARYWLEDNKCYSTWFITWSRGYNIFSRVRSVHEKPLTMNLHQLFHSQIAPHFQHWACSVLSDRISWRLIVDMFWYIFRFIHPLQSVVNDNNSLFFPPSFFILTPWTRASLLVSVVERPPFLVTYLEPCRVLIQLFVLDLNSLRTGLLILKKVVRGAKCEATWRLQKSVRQSVLDKETISLSADGASPVISKLISS